MEIFHVVLGHNECMVIGKGRGVEGVEGHSSVAFLEAFE